jgi:hypothetical protein
MKAKYERPVLRRVELAVAEACFSGCKQPNISAGPWSADDCIKCGCPCQSLVIS